MDKSLLRPIFFGSVSAVVVLTLSLVACQTRDASDGSVRVSRAEVIGVYVIKFQNGLERLELKPDGTYVQEFVSENRPFLHTGNWRLEHEFLDGSAILLANAVISEEEEDHPRRLGYLTLYAHERAGRISLARNEVADWYYERQ